MFVYVCAFLLATMVAGGQFPDHERYIILLNEGSDAGDIEELIQRMEVHASSTREEMQVGSLTSILPFVYGNMSEATAEMVSKLPNVDDIIPDQAVDPYVSFERDNSIIIDHPSIYRYNLDIINDLGCADDKGYTPDNLGSGVDIYILDSGIYYDHSDFWFTDIWQSGTRAKLGFDAIDAHYNTNEQGRDPIGTGTHYAGIAGGVKSGFAKDANLYSVRVKGPAPFFGNWVTVLSGMEAVFRMHNTNSLRPDFVASIASITISGDNKLVYRASTALTAVGIITVFPSGDSPVECHEKTLCRGSLCVGAHEYEQCSCKKKIWPNSGYGTCVETIAPGVNILSASNTDYSGFTLKSGTSTASSLVAGVVACMKGSNPDLTISDIVKRFTSTNAKDIDKSEMPSCIRGDAIGKRLQVTSKLFE